MMKIKNRNTGKIYDCFTQAVDVNFDGNYVLRYNIGIENYQGFNKPCFKGNLENCPTELIDRHVYQFQAIDFNTIEVVL